MPDADGLDDTAEQVLRVGLTAAAQLAERLAQARTQAQREAAARSDHEARELAGRVEAERRAAGAQLAQTRDPRWIATATAGEIADAYATARQWAPTAPAAARDAQQILDQVHTRNGADTMPSGLDRAAGPSRREEVESPARRAARADAALLLATPDVATRVENWLAEHPQPLPGLTRADTVEAVDARVRADLSQPRPAVEATATLPPAPDPVISPRRSPALSQSSDLERD